MSDITETLQKMNSGDPKAKNKLLSLVYDELRCLAYNRMRNEPIDHTLQPTALVHEAYIRLLSKENRCFKNSKHFFVAAAQVMRWILVDIARRKQRASNGGEFNRINFDENLGPVHTSSDQVLAVHEALADLEQVDDQAARVVEFHYFIGMTHDETAEALNISPSTVYRNWSFAKTWLFNYLSKSN